MSGRQFWRTGPPGFAQAWVARERGPRGEDEPHAAQLGAQRARPPIAPPHRRDRRRRGAGRGGAVIVSAAGSPCAPCFLHEERKGPGAEAVSRSLAGRAESVEGAGLLPPRPDLVTARSTFRSTVRTGVRWEKEGAGGRWAALGAEPAATPGGRAQTLGALLRGEARNKVRPECLGRPRGGIGRLQEDALQLWQGFSGPAKQRATL
jgi:hypothetical protein